MEANYAKTEVFGLDIPTGIEGVPSEILDPINTVSCSFTFCFLNLIHLEFILPILGLQWSDKKAYKDALLKLGGLFKKNFEVFANYKIGTDNKLTEEILAAGPNF